MKLSKTAAKLVRSRSMCCQRFDPHRLDHSHIYFVVLSRSIQWTFFLRWQVTAPSLHQRKSLQVIVLPAILFLLWPLLLASGPRHVHAALPLKFRLTPEIEDGASSAKNPKQQQQQLFEDGRVKDMLNYLYPESSSISFMDINRSKKSYVDLRCRGVYDTSIFARLERVCKDCYNLYKDAEVHGLCRSVGNMPMPALWMRVQIYVFFQYFQIKWYFWTFNRKFKSIILAEFCKIISRVLQDN